VVDFSGEELEFRDAFGSGKCHVYNTSKGEKGSVYVYVEGLAELGNAAD